MLEILLLKGLYMNKVILGTELEVYFHNVLGTWTDSRGYIHARRFTDRQVERYLADSVTDGADYPPRCRATSNVTIEFTTDSDFVALEFEWGDIFGLPYISIDCMVDGRLTYNFTDEKVSHRFFAFRLPEGTHDVCILLPWNAEIIVRDMIIGENAFIRPVAKKERRILAFGDSITQGYMVDHPSMCYIGRMAQRLNAEVLNQAIGGYYFVGESLDCALSAWNPDLITVAYGTNDYSVRKDAVSFEENMRSFMEKLTEIFPDTPVLGLMPIYRNDIGFQSRLLFRDYTHGHALDMIRRVYADYKNVTVMEDTYYPQCKDFFYTDFLHPNDLGGILYGDAVADKIREVF